MIITKYPVNLEINDVEFKITFLNNKKIRKEIEKNLKTTNKKFENLDRHRNESDLLKQEYNLNVGILNSIQDDDPKKADLAVEQKRLFKEFTALDEKIKQDKLDAGDIVDELEKHYKKAFELSVVNDKNRESLMEAIEEEGLDYTMIFTVIKKESIKALEKKSKT